MPKAYAAFAAAALLTASVTAGADDMVSASGKAQQRKVMEECVHQQAEGNGKMSKEEMRRTCEQQMRAQQEANRKSTGAPPPR